MIHKFAGFCLICVGIAPMIPVVLGGATLTGIGVCLVPAAILIGLVLVIV